MRVTEIRSQTVKTYEVFIEEGEVRDQRYSKAGRQFLVDHATVVKKDGNFTSAKIHGAVLKKDGSPSLNRVTETFYGQSDWPAWLHGIVGGLA